MTALLAVPLFAGGGWAGALTARVLCATRTPYDDGPAPRLTGPLPFVLAGGCIGVVTALRGGSPEHVAILFFAVVALTACAAADLACGALPDVLTLIPLGLTLAVSAVARDPAPALGAAFVAVPFAVAALVSRGRGMGWGDVKLAALGGSLLGAPDATFALVLAALAAYLGARATRGALRPVAFGPYLAASIAATLSLMRTI